MARLPASMTPWSAGSSMLNQDHALAPALSFSRLAAWSLVSIAAILQAVAVWIGIPWLHQHDLLQGSREESQWFTKLEQHLRRTVEAKRRRNLITERQMDDEYDASKTQEKQVIVAGRMQYQGMLYSYDEFHLCIMSVYLFSIDVG